MVTLIKQCHALCVSIWNNRLIILLFLFFLFNANIDSLAKRSHIKMEYQNIEQVERVRAPISKMFFIGFLCQAHLWVATRPIRHKYTHTLLISNNNKNFLKTSKIHRSPMYRLSCSYAGLVWIVLVWLLFYFYFFVLVFSNFCLYSWI